MTGLEGVWQTLQPDWPLLLMAATILLLVLTLLTFLVAALLLRRHNERKADQWTGYEREWGSLLESAYTGEATSEDVRSAIDSGEHLFFVDFLYKQALRMHEPEKRAVLTRLAMPYLPLITARTRGGDAERRARAVKTLAELGGKHHVHTLIAALDDPSPLVSMSAARGLARAAGAGSVREIVSRLDRFSDWNSRFLRATLAQLGPGAATTLRDSVRNPALSPRVRGVCLEALGELGDVEAAELAADTLWTEQDVDLRAASLRLLRRCGGPAQAEAVRPLCRHEDPVIRAQAVGTLARIGEERDMLVLEEALRDPSAWVALHAARGLKARGRRAVLERTSTSADPATATGVALQVLREEA
jgi:HEAT repeat protein